MAEVLKVTDVLNERIQSELDRLSESRTDVKVLWHADTLNDLVRCGQYTADDGDEGFDPQDPQTWGCGELHPKRMYIITLHVEVPLVDVYDDDGTRITHRTFALIERVPWEWVSDGDLEMIDGLIQNLWEAWAFAEVSNAMGDIDLTEDSDTPDRGSGLT